MKTSASILRGAAAALALLVLVSCATGMSMPHKEAVAHYKLGLSHLNDNDLQGAFVEFQKSLRLNDYDKDVHQAIGVVYLRLEDTDNAEKEFKRAISIDPDYSEAYNNLCVIHYKKLDYDGAIADCRKALENQLYATPEKSYYTLGRIYYRMGNYKDAMENFIQASRRAPMLPDPYYGLALAYNASGNFGKASEAITRAISIDGRFRGDKVFADSEFRKQVLMGGDDARDLKDLIEILKY